MNERTIFMEALELGDPRERAEFLRRACGGDETLRERVGALLRCHGSEGSFVLDRAPAVDVTVTADPPTMVERPGAAIGPYKLLEPIGEGGMGTVYMAEQTHPVRRKVALKVIKPGMDTKQVIARFEAERQALAMMDHPNIARVLDAGATDSGRPYFVMELVRGVPITEYCDREHLSISERLELFVLVCRAVQHAHQKGVIHRDIKPTNVLITLHDGVPVPKVIDFGIAKATGQSLTERTLYTGFAQLVGTPLYMSPEQAEMSGLDVDTRSDVYSLGVLLYELVTGTTPFDQETMRKAAIDEMRRIIREEEPPKPSTRLSALGDTLTTISANRKLDPRYLGRTVRGELDWIVMRALEKDRRRRYDTANDFAADVMRYLTDLPVEACPPSGWYRFVKYTRRHRAGLTTALLLGLALITGTAISVWQARRAGAAEGRAVTAQHRAEDHLVLARQAVDELYDQVAARWTNNLRWAPLPRPFLERALPFYERFADARRVDTAVGRAYRRVGEIQLQLGRNASANESFRRAEAIFEALAAVEQENLEHIHDLAACYSAHAWFDDQQVHQKAVSLRESLVKRQPGNALYQKELAESYHHYGVSLWTSQQPGAEDQLNRAREIQERLCKDRPDDDDLRSRLGMTLRDIGNRYRDTGHPDDAEPLQWRALAIHEDLVDRFPTRPQYRLQLGWSCWERGRTLLALQRNDGIPELSGRAADIFRGLVHEYPDVKSFRSQQADALADVARAQYRLGNRAEAARAVDRVIDLGHGDRLRYIGADFVYGRYGAHAGVSDPELGIDLLKRAQAARTDTTPFTRRTLGIGYYRLGEIDAAVCELEGAEGLRKDSGHQADAIIEFFLAMGYQKKGDNVRARDCYNRATAWMAEHSAADSYLENCRAEAAQVLGQKDPPANAVSPKAEPTGPE